MKQHKVWWKRVYTEFIKNKTRRELSETSWREALKWLQQKAFELAMDGKDLTALASVIEEELNSQ